MATRRPLVVISGVVQELPVGDSTAGASGGSGDYVLSIPILKANASSDPIDISVTGATVSIPLTKAGGTSDPIVLNSSSLNTNWVSTSINFGSIGKYSASFSIANAAATTASIISVIDNSSDDSNECDGIILSGKCLVNGTVTIYASSTQGPISGVRNICYILE